MISVCGAILNGKPDAEMFVEALKCHNPGVDFEIVITHDDRVDDGSAEHFARLQEKHPNLKFVKNSHEDTVRYLTKLLDWYDQTGKFREQFRKDLRKNLQLFAEKKLFDHNKSFLWLTSSVLYNRAIEASKGDTIVVSPADFIYGFRLRDLEHFVSTHSRDGRFYGKPSAIWARISNADPTWLRNHIDEVHRGVGFREGFRYDSRELFRDFLKGFSNLNDFFVADFRNNQAICLGDPNCIDQLYRYNREAIQLGQMQVLPQFHGYHVVSRKTFNEIGGFNEAWLARAYSDDCFTYHGKNCGNYVQLPAEYSVYWCGPFETCPYHGQGYPVDWVEQLKQRDSWYSTHPIPTSDNPTYLYNGLLSGSQMAEEVNAQFSKGMKPLRIA